MSIVRNAAESCRPRRCCLLFVVSLELFPRLSCKWSAGKAVSGSKENQEKARPSLAEVWFVGPWLNFYRHDY